MEFAIIATLFVSPAMGIPLIIAYYATMGYFYIPYQCLVASVLNVTSNECIKCSLNIKEF